ncbi:MAG: S49 family peptidase [Betaproteobacteria bacterium]|nr:S49 family peptidase [Betaproteobacteria bacterium]
MNPLLISDDRLWAIMPERLDAIRAAAVPIEAALEMQAALGESRLAAPMVGVQVIPLMGVITRRPGPLAMLFGATGLDTFGERFRGALADPQVQAIVLHVDSPGGGVFGVPEMAAEILAGRGTKPIVAFADGFMASAAYWIASAADSIVAAPSSQVGSIGVLALHYDFSRALDAEGITPTYITSAQYKADGAPEMPLSGGARAHLQAQVDALHRDFVRAVATGRGVSQAKVNADFGQGRVLLAQDAVAAGMADRLGTMETVLAGLMGGKRRRGMRAEAEAPELAAVPPPLSPAAALEIARARLALRG